MCAFSSANRVRETVYFSSSCLVLSLARQMPLYMQFCRVTPVDGYRPVRFEVTPVTIARTLWHIVPRLSFADSAWQDAFLVMCFSADFILQISQHKD